MVIKRRYYFIFPLIIIAMAACISNVHKVEVQYADMLNDIEGFEEGKYYAKALINSHGDSKNSVYYRWGKNRGKENWKYQHKTGEYTLDLIKRRTDDANSNFFRIYLKKIEENKYEIKLGLKVNYVWGLSVTASEKGVKMDFRIDREKNVGELEFICATKYEHFWYQGNAIFYLPDFKLNRSEGKWNISRSF